MPETWDEQVARSSLAYLNGGDTEIQADEDAREALAADTFTPVANSALWNVAPADKVQTIDPNPTEMGTIVKDLADADALYTKGGPTADWVHNTADLSDGVDGLFLAERSKQTGEKFF